MSHIITGTDAYVFIAALACATGVSDSTALKYCRENFEAFCEREGINKEDFIQCAAKVLANNAFSDCPFGKQK